MFGVMNLDRQLFSGAPQAASMRRALLALDGSTTKVCAAITQQPVTLILHQQSQAARAPNCVQAVLGNGACLTRVSSLVAAGQVLMDNLAYIRLDGLATNLLRGLTAGTVPIGHLLAGQLLRREALHDCAALGPLLWQIVGLPDLAASRAYQIVDCHGPLMVIFETFRAGLSSSGWNAK